MPKKSPPDRREKFTDAERHARFVKTAREVGASEKAKDFDSAFEKITIEKPRKSVAANGD